MNELELPIVDMLPDNASAVEQCATLLFEVFQEHHPAAWPDMASARREVEEFFAEGRISRIAVDSDGTVVGWVGAIRAYDGFAWELHPLVVRPERQRRGLGRRLVADIEDRVRERGAVTLWLGTDDENNQTSLGGIDVYDDPLRPSGAHPQHQQPPLRVLPQGWLCHSRGAAGRQWIRQAGHLDGEAGGVGSGAS